MSVPDYRVETRHLVKSFGSFRAVDDVSISVEAGEIFGFLGSNGAGKTTTMRILCGLLRPSSGEAWVNGLNVETDPELVRAQIGYMSQRFSLYNELTVAENLRFFGGIYAIPRELQQRQGNQMLELFGLAARQHQVTGILPGGLKQRLALACAVLHEPAVLFLDEPTSGVDPVARRSFWELIRRLADTGKTVFVTTHYMEEATYCDRLALMHRGRIIALDTPDGLRGRLDSDRLIGLSTSAPGQVSEALAGSELVNDAWIAGRGVNVLLRSGSRPRDVVAGLRGLGLEVHSLGSVQPSIEDVFVTLIEAEEESLQ